MVTGKRRRGQEDQSMDRGICCWLVQHIPILSHLGKINQVALKRTKKRRRVSAEDGPEGDARWKSKKRQLEVGKTPGRSPWIVEEGKRIRLHFYRRRRIYNWINLVDFLFK